MSIKVSIVEDDPGTREHLMAILSGAPELDVLTAFPNAEEALAGLPGNPPDVVLMDIRLPGMSGISCVAELKARLPKLEILMVTTYEEPDLIFESLRSGATGYLLKNMPPSELVQAVLQAHAGGSPISIRVARKIVNHFQQIQRPASEVEQLTKREHEILGLLAKGFLYKEIAEQLGISLNTVRVHVQAVYHKLQVQTRTEAVVKYLKDR